MPQFAFVAKDRMGNTVQGKVEAADPAFAANQVGQMGYTLIDLRPDAPTPTEPTLSMGSAALVLDRTQAMSASAPGVSPTPASSLSPYPTPLPAASLESTPSRPQTATQSTDILQEDLEKRRKVEADLIRMGMSPAEIRRLLDANPNTTEPPPITTASVAEAVPSARIPTPPELVSSGRKDAKSRLAARTADLHSFAAQLQASSAANRVQAIEAISLDLPDFRDSTPEERQQAETMLREVYALRRREKYTEALAKCREALNLVPSDAAALEMFGDLLQGVARTDEALAAYKRATEADAKRISAERKYGDLLTRQQHYSDIDPEEAPRHPIVSAIFSFLLPGAGQLHNGERAKGIVLLTCAGLCVAFWLLLAQGKTGYLPSWQMPGGKPAPAASTKRIAVDWGAETPMLASRVFYLTLSVFSAIDAAKGARRTRGAV